MKQMEREPDKTLADKQKEPAGAIATFGQNDQTKYIPITVFCFRDNLLLFSQYMFYLQITTH